MGKFINVGGRDFNISQVKTIRSHANNNLYAVIEDIDGDFTIIKDTAINILSANISGSTGVFFISGVDTSGKTVYVCVNHIEEYEISSEDSNYIVIKFVDGKYSEYTGFTTAQLDAELEKIGAIQATTLTALEVKTLYESNADTNAFTTAEQTKLGNALTTSDMIDEDGMTSNSPTKVPTQQSVKAYVDNNITGGITYKGGYNANTNTPDLDTSPSGVLKGDMYTVIVAGIFFTANVEVGDALIAEVNDASLESDWTIIQKNLDASSIKTLYESNNNTNAFTDQDQSDLSTAITHANSTHGAVDATVKYPGDTYSTYPEGTSRYYVLKTDGWASNGLLINTRDNTLCYQQLVMDEEGIVSRSWSVPDLDWTPWKVFGLSILHFEPDGISNTFYNPLLAEGAYDVIYQDQELIRGSYTQTNGSFTLPFVPIVGSILWARLYGVVTPQEQNRSIYISDLNPDPLVGNDGDIWFKFY